MTGHKEPEDIDSDSEVILQPLLQTAFSLTAQSLDDDQLTHVLLAKIQEIPNKDTAVISLIGGAASGKSSLSKTLLWQLEKAGIKAASISTDDFNRGDRSWRRQHFEGDNPRDQIEKYDFDLMRQKIIEITRLSDGSQTVGVPQYDQETGLAIDGGYKRRIGNVDILIVEGDFHPVKQPDLTIFLHLHDSHRLQHRIDRDAQDRAEPDPQKTTDSFNYRHTHQHLPYTMRAAEHADIIIVAEPAGKSRIYDIYTLNKPGD